MKLLSLLHHILLALAFAAGARGQNPAVSPAPSASSATSAAVEPQEFIPLTPDRRAAVRELQYHIGKADARVSQLQLEIDELTIRNLQEINKLRQQQVEWNADISVIATDFAQVMKVDRSLWELDQINLRLTKKMVAPENKPVAQPK